MSNQTTSTLTIVHHKSRTTCIAMCVIAIVICRGCYLINKYNTPKSEPESQGSNTIRSKIDKYIGYFIPKKLFLPTNNL